MWQIKIEPGTGRRLRLFRHETQEGTWAAWPGGSLAPEQAVPEVASSQDLGAKKELSAATTIRAPMTSRVIAVTVSEGQNVSEGDVVAVVEAMKMEYPLVCQMRGRVKTVHHTAQKQVSRGDLIVTLEVLDDALPKNNGTTS